MKDISTPINKVDNDEKMSGKAKYVADIKMEGMLYAFTVRSSIVKGRIVSITYPKIPDGYFVVDHRDILGKNIVKVIYEDMPVFTKNEITYLYEPISLLVGPDKEVLSTLVNKKEIIYEEEEPVFDWVDSVINYHFEKGKGF
ncbi:MAG: hypothetical protein PHW21_03255, partial [Candidatus Izemoplasmatales bacterium]|nr:hypothetical protein [Candidatus Izemoplasmatales bacterium]